jgi:MFS family permease
VVDADRGLGRRVHALLDVTIVNVDLPEIQRQLGGSLSNPQLVIEAHALSLAALLLTTGSLADLLGRRRGFAVGIAVFTAGSLISGLEQSPLRDHRRGTRGR